MNAIILAAGYATRLYPLTRDLPKPLLKVGDRTILDRLIDPLSNIDAIQRLVLVTNHRFFPLFAEWATGRRERKRITLLDDGTTTNEDRLGAVGDLAFALRQAGLEDDLLVCAADNILQFPVAEWVAAFQACPACTVCVHRVGDVQRLRRTGVAVLDAEDRVIEFAEKPVQPKTHWAVPPLYIFPRVMLARIPEYLAAGGSPEAPGHFIEWLCGWEPVYAYRVNGTILDVGTPESLAAARTLFDGGS